MAVRMEDREGGHTDTFESRANGTQWEIVLGVLIEGPARDSTQGFSLNHQAGLGPRSPSLRSGVNLGTIALWFRLDMSSVRCLWGTQVGISVRSTEQELRRKAKLWGCVGN